jgi:hypothetical protein
MKIDWDEFERTRGHEQERLDQEHPELAYRRGVQQGAYFVLEALEADPGAIDRKLLADIRRYVNSALTRWRYSSRPRRLLRAFNPPRVRRRQPPQQAADQDAVRRSGPSRPLTLPSEVRSPTARPAVYSTDQYARLLDSSARKSGGS